jgi:hypothetical protein
VQDALQRNDLTTAKAEIEYLISIRTGYDPFMTPWGLIKSYVEACETVDIDLPKILPTEYATLAHRMGRPVTSQKTMEALVKLTYLTCQYEACFSMASLTQTRFPDSVIAETYLEKAPKILGKINPKTT